MRVREYTSSDRSSCLAVFDSNVPRFFASSEREEFAAFLNTPLPGPFALIEDEAGEVLGCGGYRVRPGSTTADLCWGMIKRERHGTGLGKLLLDIRLERIHADTEVEAVSVHTSQHTCGFYRHRGFRTERVTPNGYAPGLDRCDMRLLLRAPEGRIA